jgi:hypothetical protein
MCLCFIGGIEYERLAIIGKVPQFSIDMIKEKTRKKSPDRAMKPGEDVINVNEMEIINEEPPGIGEEKDSSDVPGNSGDGLIDEIPIIIPPDELPGELPPTSDNVQPGENIDNVGMEKKIPASPNIGDLGEEIIIPDQENIKNPQNNENENGNIGNEIPAPTTDPGKQQLQKEPGHIDDSPANPIKKQSEDGANKKQGKNNAKTKK